MSSHYRTIILLCCVLSFNSAFARTKEVPMLDKNSVALPKANSLNKCIGKNAEVTYTQFECPTDAELIDPVWKENSNLTFSTHITDTKRPVILKAENDQVNTGEDILQDLLDKDNTTINFKDMKPAEILQQGIKLLILRQQILDSL